jgi:SAM-dependent methyltransferase
MKNDAQRLADEKQFHDEIFASQARKKVDKFYLINESIGKQMDVALFKAPHGKTVLEYGCGMGDKLIALDKRGARTFGIDISGYAIEQLTNQAKQVGSSTSYAVMNAEELEFEDNFFDIIFGSGILHHLDLNKSFKTISKKLSPTGKAIFVEPLGHNPIINRFRNKTPDIRTEDEHPLLMKDFALAEKFFGKVSIKYFYLATLSLPILLGGRIPKWLISLFDLGDSIIFSTLPFMRKYAWQVLIQFEQPIKHLPTDI